MTLARSTTPADMAHFAQHLAQFPASARRTEALRLVGNVMTRDRLVARGLTPPASLPSNIIGAVMTARDALARAGHKPRQWGDDQADFMACMALACQVAADAMQAEAGQEAA